MLGGRNLAARGQFQQLDLVVHVGVGHQEALLLALSGPDRVNRIGQGIAEPRIDVVVGTSSQEAKRIIEILRRSRAGCEPVQDLIDDRLILPVLLAGGFRSVEVFLKSHLKKPVIADIPVFAIPA